jgi:hypothetical protein
MLVPMAAEAVLATAKADGYKALELQFMRRCSAHMDVYSFGILPLELLMGRKLSATSDLPSTVKVVMLEEVTQEEVPWRRLSMRPRRLRPPPHDAMTLSSSRLA